MLASGAYYIMIFEFSRAFCAESIHRQKISYAMMLQHHSRLLKNGKNSAKTQIQSFLPFRRPRLICGCSSYSILKKMCLRPKVGIILIVLYSNCLHTFVTKICTFSLILPIVHIVMSDPNSPPTAPKMVPKDNLTFIELFFFSKISSLPY